MILTFSSKHAVDTFAEYFNQLRSEGWIKPEYVGNETFTYHFNEYASSKRMSAVIDDTKGGLKSIMFYDRLRFSDTASLDDFVSFYLGLTWPKASTLDGFREYSYSRDAVYVQLIESFEKRQGYASALIQALQEEEDVEFMFLDPLVQATSFYFANGFFALDVRSEAYKEGLFCWNKST